MELRPLIVILLVFGLLATAIVSFGITLSQNNNVNNTIANDPAIYQYSTNLKTDLNDSSTTANNIEKAFSNSTISLTGGIVFLDALGGLWKIMVSIPNKVFKSSLSIIKANLAGGSNEILYVFGVIFLIVVITLVFAVWKLISTGEGG